MATNTVSNLTPFDKGKELDFIENNGEILFTVEEIGHHLGYKNPRLSTQKLFREHYNELKHYSVETKTVSTDGKSYETRAFTEEGVYILSMLARTNEAKKFRARVALLLRRVRREQAERMAELAREAGYSQGLSEARALPAAEADRKAAYLDGMREGKKLQKRQDGLHRLLKIRAYLQMGLTHREIGKILGLSRQGVTSVLERSRRAGLAA